MSPMLLFLARVISNFRNQQRNIAFRVCRGYTVAIKNKEVICTAGHGLLLRGDAIARKSKNQNWQGRKGKHERRVRRPMGFEKKKLRMINAGMTKPFSGRRCVQVHLQARLVSKHLICIQSPPMIPSEKRKRKEKG